MSSLSNIPTSSLSNVIYHSMSPSSLGEPVECEALESNHYKIKSVFHDKPIEFELFFDRKNAKTIPGKFSVGDESSDNITFYLFRKSNSISNDRIYIEGVPRGKYSRLNFYISFPKTANN